MAREYRTSLIIDGDARGGIRAVNATTDEIRQLDAASARSARNTRTAALTMRQSFENVRSSVLNTKTAALGLAGAVVLRKSISDFADFEKGLIGVGKTTNIAGDELKSLGDDIQQMSLRVPVATTRLLEIAQSAGQLGVKGSSNILRFTETIAKLGSATDLAGEEGATAFARLLTVTGEPIDNVDRLGASVVALGNNYAATESQITAVAQRVAQATAQYEVGAANVLGISTALQAVGVEAEAGGTQVGLAFQTINDAIRGGGAEMERLQRITGQTGEELREAFQNGNSAQVFQAFIEGLGRIQKSGGDVNAVLDDMGLTGVRAAQVLGTLATRSGLVGKAIADANLGWDENVALNKEAAVAAESFSAQMQITANSADRAAAELGRVIAPKLLDGMTAARAAFGGIAENIDVVIASGGAAASLFAGRFLGSIATSTQAVIGARSAVIEKAKADDMAAASALRYAEVQAVTAQRSLANAQLQASLARGTVHHTAALKEVNAAQREAVRSRLAVKDATKAASAATANYTRTAGLAARAGRGLTAAMSLLGGPVGVAVLAAGALYSFRDELGLIPRPAEEAKAQVEALTGAIDMNSKAAIRNGIAQMQADLVDLKRRAADAREEYERLTEESNRRVARGGGGMVPGLPAVRAGGEAARIEGEIKARQQAIKDLEKAQDDLAARLRGDQTGQSGASGSGSSGDEAFASTLNQYDANTVKLRALLADRKTLVEGMAGADPEVVARSKRAIANIDEQIKQLGESQKRTAGAGVNAAKQLQQAYEQTAGGLQQQIALFDQTGQVAQTRYDIEHGALRGISDIQKQVLLQRAQELDALNAQRTAVQSLFPEWQKLQQASQLRQSVSDLPPDMQAFGRRRAAQMAGEAATDGLPGMQGLAPEFNGPFGEENRLEAERAQYEEQYRQRLESFQEFARTHQDQKAEADAAIEALEADHQKRMQQYDDQTAKARRVGYQSLYGDLTSIVGTFAGEQSSIYKTMFAVSKAFAIADSTVQIAGALAKAANNPFPANLAFMGTVAAQTASIVSTISSTTMAGQAHDGIDNVPNTGTWNLERGERVIDRRTNVDLKQYLQRENGGTAQKQGGDVVYAPRVAVEAKQGVSDEDARRQGQQIEQGMRDSFRSFVVNEMRPGGLFENVKRTG